MLKKLTTSILLSVQAFSSASTPQTSLISLPIASSRMSLSLVKTSRLADKRGRRQTSTR